MKKAAAKPKEEIPAVLSLNQALAGDVLIATNPGMFARCRWRVVNNFPSQHRIALMPLTSTGADDKQLGARFLSEYEFKSAGFTLKGTK